MGTWHNAACCEACWIHREATSDAAGNVTTVRVPVRITPPRLETCCFCGATTIFGVYVRAETQPNCDHPEE